MTSAPPPHYVMLQNTGSLQPPPYRRNVPRYHSHRSSGSGGCCLKCICCCYCLLFFFIFLVFAISFYIYIFYHPQIPSYSVQDLQVQAFDVKQDFSLDARFLVTVKAENPNENIGFIYGHGGSVSVLYTDSILCSGKLPSFHQGHRNTTMMKVFMEGKSAFGSGLQEALMENKNSGRIPLLVKVKAPVSIVLEEFPTREFTVLVNCSLVVDNLSPNKKIGIISSVYTVGFGL